ncbi:glucosaminidase domain-containing protein [Duganella sp. HH105]|uniref:glucosaminidase domain-containing protein n=1 Tax=Duganella sp. HH105 TaxID=1781067 RepID=UPI000877CF43|nr:glucosaminidase domain-containing protein [Duganella sp. HH105]OEZ57686.1 peptidoglycan hydrolase FlgJ [Duganella sp. HH105]
MSKHAHALAQIHAHKHAHKSKPRQQPAHVARFMGLHVSDAQIIAARTGIPAEVILAQSTHEVTLAGKRVSEIDEFRAYTSYAEAADDYASLIRRKYPTVMSYRGDPEKFAEAVARRGYATDPYYAQKLKSIIHLHITPLLKN